jgi:hypothetical protein
VAIVVLVLWTLTAGAGLRLLFTSGLGGRPQPAEHPRSAPAEATVPSAATGPANVAAPAYPAYGAYGAPASKREARRAAQAMYDPPTLTRNKNEPIPGLKPLMEFAHPMFGIIGLAFWLGYALIHNRALAWIAFGLAVATICMGLAWFAANTRAARRRAHGEPGPSFSARLIVIHGSAAALTFTLAALTALIAHG